ncbi:hypothetical protein JTE90_025308 [Oedothorax gibbosus]|uniref:Metalloendopeptidase n=1 Tax=Oedothorax gibbosus TaxID=931172 RepID=A0AAV6V5Y9_9ARAC|nr:hypothetical protein JTE90_025308 [Oedothorax gibbosus]
MNLPLMEINSKEIIGAHENNEIIENEDNKYVDPLETSGEFEGDIILETAQDKNAVRNENLKWPGGIVPYTIARDFGKKGRQEIKRAVNEFARHSCVKFVPRTDQRDYLSIVRGAGCSSHVGRRGGKQELTLAPPCDRVTTVMHEFMHALGFWHEQSRTDRDDYVSIRWENIKPGDEHNFLKYNLDVVQFLGEGYDYSSLMHYGDRYFSKNEMPTIVPKRPVGKYGIGQKIGFSRTDIRKINKLYNCNRHL